MFKKSEIIDSEMNCYKSSWPKTILRRSKTAKHEVWVLVKK